MVLHLQDLSQDALATTPSISEMKRDIQRYPMLVFGTDDGLVDLALTDT